MTKKVLLLLAGYPGIGKSTLLATAVEKRLPIFGQEFGGIFGAMRPPPRLPEDTLRGEELLAAGAWFTDHHLPYLFDLEVLPACVVLHVDLVSLIGYRPHLRNLPENLEALIPFSMQTLATPALVGALYRHVLGHAFFRRFDAVVVNTLTAPWATVAERWRGRDEAQGRPDTRSATFLRRRIFGPAELGERIHASLHAGWLQAVSEFGPARSWQSAIVDGELRIDISDA